MEIVGNFCVPELHLCVSVSGWPRASRLDGGVFTEQAPVSSLTVSFKHPWAALGILLGVAM